MLFFLSVPRMEGRKAGSGASVSHQLLMIECCVSLAGSPIFFCFLPCCSWLLLTRDGQRGGLLLKRSCDDVLLLGSDLRIILVECHQTYIVGSYLVRCSLFFSEAENTTLVAVGVDFRVRLRHAVRRAS